MRWLQDDEGAAAAEFGLVVPVLLLMLLSIIKGGIVFNNYIQLTNSASIGARQFAISRTATLPYTSTITAIETAAPGLNAAALSDANHLKLYVDGVQCADDAGCQATLAAAPGGVARLEVAYPCDLTIMGFDYAPNCMMTSSISQRIE